ncbi:beta-propeller domain-containing protein [Baekduia soli]|nr:beta-propeller domain-containing protein [Baekduia soli]
MRRASILALSAVAGLAAAPAAQAATRAPRLTTFSSCRALLSYARVNAARAGGVGSPVLAVQGAPTGLASPVTKTTGTAEDQPAPAPTASAPAAGSTTPAFSSTNVQEAGIDEPDIVKTDGRRIVSVADGVLRVVDVSGDAPRLTGTLKLDGSAGQQILLRGDRVLVISSVATAIPVEGPVPVAGPAPVAVAARTALLPYGSPTTLLTEVDITDPATPTVARTMTLPGGFVDARMTGGTVRVVVSSTPAPRAVPLARASLRTFVPATTIRSRISGRTFRRGVVPCGAVRHPASFSGLGLLTVLTVDLDRGLYDVDRDAIMAGAETVYGSADSLYVASRRYVPGLQDTGDVPRGLRTEIDRFDASQPGVTRYAGSGTVPGFVVGQYALSEQDGRLRVASTDEPAWLPETAQADPAQSYVTVLAPRPGGGLAQVGQVGGLGRGQRIYAVRFVGSTGYVVTFRQIDPLYTLDLSDPAAPKVVGELELSGYSAYLHPLGDGLLLGVGQEASAAGRPEGTQISLFDVSDPAHPRRLQHAVYGSGSSDAEFDPHAFLWWAATGLAVIPLQLPPSIDPATGRFTGNDAFTGAVGLHVARDGIAEVGRVVHGTGAGVAPVGRSLVVGDRLYTLSSLGLQAARLDTLAPTAFVAFDQG